MSPRNSKRLLPVIALGGLLAAGSAWALKTDKNQPINVHSDHGDFKADPNNPSKGTGVYTGHVIITQGSIVINADKAVFHVVDNDLDTADITGNPATFVQQPDKGLPMHGQSLEITYDVPKNEIVLITQARLTQQVVQPGKSPTAAPKAPTVIAGIVVDDISVPGERLMTAERIRYNTDTQHVIARAGDAEQRVHVSFPPKALIPVPATATGTKAKQAMPAAVTRNHAAPVVLMPRSEASPPASTPAATSTLAPAAASHAGPP
jgi:lipopolysaccharide export system protein LptA